MSGEFDKLFSQAFEKFDECMKLVGEGIDSLFNEAGKSAKETKIVVKAGSTVYLGKGVYAKLTSNVDAIIVSASEGSKENTEEQKAS